VGCGIFDYLILNTRQRTKDGTYINQQSTLNQWRRNEINIAGARQGPKLKRLSWGEALGEGE